MATLLGANVYIKPSGAASFTKHNTNPVGTVSGTDVTLTGYDVSDVVAPGASFEAQFSKVYDNGTESAKSPAKTYTLASASDTTAPTIQSATIEDAAPSNLVVVFSETVNITDLTGLSITGTGAPTINSVTGTGTSTLTFVLSAAATGGESWTLDVAGTNTITDNASNALAATTQAITNNVGAAASLSAVEATSPAIPGTYILGGFSLKPDGASLYISNGGDSTSNNTGDQIQEHVLSTAYDITTLNTTVNTAYPISDNNFAHYNQVVDNGTKLLTSNGFTGGLFIKANLSTAYNLSTGTFDYSTAITGRLMRAMKMSPDGTKFFQAQVGNRDIHQYTLSTPYEITSRGSAVVYTHTATDFGATGMDISSDGLTIIVADQVASIIRVIKLGTAWDITSVTEELNFSITGGTYSATVYNKSTGAVYILNLDNRTIQKRTLTL